MEIVPEYKRDTVVACVTRFYELLVRMGYMEDSNILHAPPGGWGQSKIDAKSLRMTGRNERVIDLLQHLPYMKHNYEVMPETTPIEYLGMKWPDNIIAEDHTTYPHPFCPFDAALEPGMICLTHGRAGTWWLIDTAEGIMYAIGTHFDVEMSPESPPWTWYRAVGFQKYFDRLHRKFHALELVPMPAVIHHRKRGQPNKLEHQVLLGFEQESIPARRIFRDHGWPIFEIFRMEECIKAVTRARLQVVERRTLGWYESDIKNAENSGDIEEKERHERRLEQARIEYSHEWDE